MRKLTCFVLISMLIVSAVPLAEAAGTKSRTLKSGNYEYLINKDKTVSFAGYKGDLGDKRYMSMKSFTIPGKVDGYPVTEIHDYAFSYWRSLTDLTLPDALTSIGEGAFNNCLSLRSLSIPASVIRIHKKAFVASGVKELIVVKGSYAEEFCKENQMAYSYSESANEIEKAEEPSSQLVLSAEKVTIEIGKTQKLTAAIEPGGKAVKKAAWESSDDSVATVKGGIVKAVSCGECEIICKVNEGIELQSTCHLTVIKMVKTVKAKNKKITLSGGGKYILELSIAPSDASNTVMTFESSDETVATVTSKGEIEGVGNGKAKITAKTTDGSEKNAVVEVAVIDHRISIDVAKKVACTVITNDRSIDIFMPDGYTVDKKLLHGYSHFLSNEKLIDEGEWITQDGGNTWHVEGLQIALVNSKTTFSYTMDITYDGKNYHASNVAYYQTNNEEHMSNDEKMYPYLIVAPDQI